MSYYNKSAKYNFKVPNGGGMYNSAKYTVLITDSAVGLDNISDILCSLGISDTAIGTDNINATVTLFPIFDFGLGTDTLGIVNNLFITDTCDSTDTVYILANMNIEDTGTGMDLPNIAKVNFLITDDNMLNPLGVYVLRDSRQDLFPSLKQKIEEIPGKHGEILFETKFGSRSMELQLASIDGLSISERENLKRTFAKYLNPTQGIKTLAFSNDLSKTYIVKYSGKIDLNQHSDWMSFTIPLKMMNSYISGSFENTHFGSGTLNNSGTLEAPFVINIVGESINPSIIIDDNIISYSGTIPAGNILIIDTENLTAELDDGTNVLHNLSNGIPNIKLQPGNTSVVANVSFIWRNRWI